MTTPTRIGIGSVLKDPLFLAGLLLALAVSAGTGWAFFGRTDPESKLKKSAVLTHMHCPACQDEIPYSEALDGQSCENCGEEKYVATHGPFKEGHGGGKFWGRFLVVFFVSLIALQGAFFYGVARLRALRKAAIAESQRRFVTACPYCQRKVKYPISIGGTGFTCVKCKTAFVLPTDGEEADAD
jgi:ribosomal protein L37AE/L43A